MATYQKINKPMNAARKQVLTTPTKSPISYETHKGLKATAKHKGSATPRDGKMHI